MAFNTEIGRIGTDRQIGPLRLFMEDSGVCLIRVVRDIRVVGYNRTKNFVKSPQELSDLGHAHAERLKKPVRCQETFQFRS